MRQPARNIRHDDFRSAAIGTAALVLLGGAAVLASRRRRPDIPRKIRQSAALMGASILADSGMEHLRGNYHNPAMYVAPTMAAASALGAAYPARSTRPVHAGAVLTGAAGIGFHAFNILKRPGRIDWNNLFYGAPLGAPGGLMLAGVLALADGARTRSHGRMLAAFTALATLAEVSEVALLHFRGAYHNPGMLVPVALPPAAAALLMGQAIRPQARTRRLTRAMLRIMGAMGVVGTGFHIYGVGRGMGGWRNWRQNVFAGPPLPAPASFSALAIAGDAALDLIDGDKT